MSTYISKFGGGGARWTLRRFYRLSGPKPEANFIKSVVSAWYAGCLRAMTVIICYVKSYNVKSDNNKKARASVDIVITEWALDAYLELKHRNVFTAAEYRKTIRPDVGLLKGGFPTVDPKFENSKFWGPATDKSRKTIPSAFKMKWHQVGPGAVQLRLLVVVHIGRVLLCRAYVKHDEKTDHREAARLKIHLKDIMNGQFVARGML